MSTELVLPPGFEDYAWEVEAKGVFWDATVDVHGTPTQVTFYDPVRLAQDVAENLAGQRPFAAKRVLVIERLTAENMRAAVNSAPPRFFV